MEQEFENFLRNSLKEFLKQRIDEVSRAKLSYLYKNKEGELRSDKEVKEILNKFYLELDKIIDLYINELKKEGLDTHEKIGKSHAKVNELTNKVEKELIKRLKEISK